MNYFSIILDGVSLYLANLWGWHGIRIVAIVLTAVIAYLLGSINFGIIVSKHLFHDDVRNYGSGNAGSTNMLRTYGKKGGALTFVGDFLKGVLAAAIGLFLFGCIGGYTAALFAVVGHAFPAYYHFKGGKGVATLAGAAFVLNSSVFFCLILLFAALVLVSKYVSLGSIMSAAVWPLLISRWGSIGGLLIGLGNAPVVWGTCTLLAFLAAALVVFLHRSNLVRLLKGTESKVDFKKLKEKTGDDQ